LERRHRLFALLIVACVAFLPWMRRARGRANQLGNYPNQLRLTTILGTDSTRSFYFAVQQLFVVS